MVNNSLLSICKLKQSEMPLFEDGQGDDCTPISEKFPMG